MILGIRGIEESSVYQDIFSQGEAKGRVEGRVEGRAEGAVEEARNTLLRQGRKKFGEPDGVIAARVTAIDRLDRLNDLLDRILEVSNWERDCSRLADHHRERAEVPEREIHVSLAFRISTQVCIVLTHRHEGRRSPSGRTRHAV